MQGEEVLAAEDGAVAEVADALAQDEMAGQAALLGHGALERIGETVPLPRRAAEPTPNRVTR